MFMIHFWFAIISLSLVASDELAHHCNVAMMQSGTLLGDPVAVPLFLEYWTDTITDGGVDAEESRQNAVGWAHVTLIIVFLTVGIFSYAYSRRITQKNSDKTPLVSQYSRGTSAPFWTKFVPHIHVVASALTAAVMLTEASTMQNRDGMPAACLAVIGTGMSSIALGIYLLMSQQVSFDLHTADPWRWHLIQGILSGNTPLMAYYAISRIGFLQAYAVMATTPLWVALLAALIVRQPWGVVQQAFCVAGAVGVVLVLQPRSLFANDAPEIDGAIYALCFAVFTAGATLICNEKLRGENPIVVSFFTMIFGTGCAAILLATGALPGLSDTETADQFRANDLLMIFEAVLVGGLLTLMSMLRTAGFCMAESSIVANVLYLEVLFATLLNIFTTHGSVNAWSIIGSVTILVGCTISMCL